MSDTPDGQHSPEGRKEQQQQRHAISCINCRTRKVKCDKVYPCGPCQKLQVDCAFRAKKARPKKAAISKSKSSDINSRLDRLDQLVSRLGSLQHQLPSDVQSLLTNSSPSELSKPESGPGTGKPAREPEFGKGYPQMRSDFWMNLSDEVEGLRHTLCNETTDEEPESSDDGLDGSSPQDQAGGPSSSTNMASFIFSRDNKMQMHGRKHPNAAEVLRLSEIFFERVDTLFKYLHGPTVRNLIGRVVAEGERPMLSKPEQALMFAIYYAAVNSMQDREYALLQQDRKSALMYYKNCTEAALSDANLLCTTDLVTLQAFITYLLALRSIDSSQSCWSLIGLAIRLAQALDLHRDTSCSRMPPYDVQMRRRLYWQLCVMDIQAFQDRGLSPLLQSTVPTFPSLPANVDDADFGPDTKEPIMSRISMTEMTIPLLSYILSQTALRMASRPNNTLQSGTKHVTETLRGLHDIITEQMKYFDMTRPICWFGKLVLRIAILKMFLLAHIPVHIRLRKVQPEITKQEVLAICVTIMELHDWTQEREPMNRFSWYHSNWHQWHPLAVALAELITTPTGPLADRAWLVVSNNFRTWRNSVADGHRGALWRPIKKLYDRARKARLQAIGGKASTPSTTSDMSSPAADLGIPKQQEVGEAWHRLHDTALRRALGFSASDSSALLFLLPDQYVCPAESNINEYMASMANAPGGPEAPINWDDWNAFLRESYESGVGAPESFDENLMQGIMDMPLELAPTEEQFFQLPMEQKQMAGASSNFPIFP